MEEDEFESIDILAEFEIGDNRDKLTNYFDWLAGVYPIMEEQLQECFSILKTQGILYWTLLDIPTVLWKE